MKELDIETKLKIAINTIAEQKETIFKLNSDIIILESKLKELEKDE